MQTTTVEVASDTQTTYPECIREVKSSNRVQALLWLLIAVVLFVIYSQQPDKDNTMGSIQITLVLLLVVLGAYKFFSNNSKLTYIPTGSIVKKHEYSFNVALESDILCCLEEGNVARLRALKNDSAGGLLVEMLTSQDQLYIAARVLKYAPHAYAKITDWITIKGQSR